MRAFRLRPAIGLLGAIALAATSLPAAGARSPQTLYTAQQALIGEHEYGAYCAVCHGSNLAGPQLPLKGAAFTSLGKDTGMTLGQFFDFLVRDTPAGSIKSLSHDQYVTIMAYILEQNGYAPGPRPLRFEQALHLTSKIAEQAPPKSAHVSAALATERGPTSR